MFRRRLISRTLQFCAVGASFFISAKPGAAEPGKVAQRTCASAYGAALKVEQSGKLRQARDQLLSCANAPCSGLVRQQCLARYTQLEADIPSVVPLVTSEDGDPRVDVQVSIDNEPLTNRLDGRSLAVDPGVHEFSFSSEGKVLATQKIFILQGQRNRPISVAIKPDRPAINAKTSPEKPAVDRAALEKHETDTPPSEKAAPETSPRDTAPSEARAPEAPPVDPPKKSGRGPMPYVLGTVGLVGLGGAGLLTYWGRKDNDLLSGCKPNCSSQSVDHVRKLYVAADVSFGVGAAALATSLVWFLASGPSKEEPRTQAGYRFDVHPIPSGSLAAVSGSF